MLQPAAIAAAINSDRDHEICITRPPSFRLPGLAAQQRLGMALEIVRQHPDRAGRAADLMQRAVESLALH